MRAIIIVSTFAGILGAISSAEAQNKNPNAALQQRLESQYALTQPTADNTDIVTAGAVLVLQRGKSKDDHNLVLPPVSGADIYQNTYKDGKIVPNGAAATKSVLRKVSRFGGFVPGIGGAAAGAAGAADGATSATTGADARTYVPGEKMWVTNIEVRDNSVVFTLFTDPVANRDNMRFKGALTFQFAGSMPPADQVEKVIAEVFKVQPGDANAQAAAPAAPAAAPQQAQQAAEPNLEPIAPPPPPPDAPAAPPKTISLGQTKEEVVAIFGQPVTTANVGGKEIYVYKDLKVTFVKGKVTDVQ
jgi:hypothetical protein